MHSRARHFITVAILILAGCVTAPPTLEPFQNTKTHWAFVPPERPDLSAVREIDWFRNDIDRISETYLINAQEQPLPEADRRTLMRRVHFDLIGLPPTPEEIAAFEKDSLRNPDSAFENLVDRLLASPHFGEKWARWWMDLAHYGDSDGYLTDQLRPVAWRWRQWVVEAFNRNLPFDQFTIEQLAGDLLPNATTQQRIATGFLRNTLSNREGGADIEEFRVLQVKDRTSTFGIVWLGLTVGCAQCHDHKYDPISQKEFYQLYAFFNNADEVNINAPLPAEAKPFAIAKLEHDKRRRDLLSPVATKLDAVQKRWEAKLLDTEAHPGRDHNWDRDLELLGLVWGGQLGEGQLEGLNIIYKPWPQRTATERDRLQDYFLRKGSRIDGAKFKELKISALVKQLDELKKKLPPVTRAPTMQQHHEYRPTHLHQRGNFRRKGEALQPDTLAVLPPFKPKGKPDRLALARWTVSPDNPLTARVTVNRLWQELFGSGIIHTPDDFGANGDRPGYHILRLDWLASEFVQSKWDVKAMLKLMVMSATYRQSSTWMARFQQPKLIPTLETGIRIPHLEAMWQGLRGHYRQRLSAELIRDNALAVSGLLNRKIGGPSVRPPQPESVIKEAFQAKWEPSKGADQFRRGLYTFIQRTAPFGQMVTFDFPDNNQPCTRRERSNTPLQALNLLNDPTFFAAAQALAARVLREGGETTRERLDHVFLLCLARAPSTPERARLEKYLAAQVEILMDDPKAAKAMASKPVAGIELAEQAAWVGVASVLLNLDEFITKE